MANRSTNIASNVLKTLERHGINILSIDPDDIYSAISTGVSAIISEINFNKEISITLATGQELYPLTGGNSRKNIASVRIVKVPATWLYDFELLPNREFAEKARALRNTALSQPVYGEMIDSQLRLFPVPAAGQNGDTLTLLVTLSGASTDVSATVLPELPEDFDKCLEYYTTAHFLTGKDSEVFHSRYLNELKRLGPIAHRNTHSLAARPVKGWL